MHSCCSGPRSSLANSDCFPLVYNYNVGPFLPTACKLFGERNMGVGGVFGGGGGRWSVDSKVSTMLTCIFKSVYTAVHESWWGAQQTDQIKN